MKSILVLLLAVCMWFAAGRPVHASGPFGAEPTPSGFSCGYSGLSAIYSAKSAKYYFTGACLQANTQINVPWTAEGGFDPATGDTKETIILNGPSSYRGTLRIYLSCAGLRENLDPWLTSVKCTASPGGSPLNAQGEFVSRTNMLEDLKALILGRSGPLTSGFPYDRNALLAKRDSDLKAEAAAIAKAEADKRRAEEIRQAALQPKSYMGTFSYPTVLLPTRSQRFFAQSPVPIKLAPPQGWKATSYMISIQRSDNRGNWVAYGNPIPVSAADAQSAGGYTGFGAGGNGPTKYPVLLTAPGYWRLNAQVSAPNQSAWSDWVEFTVTAPPPVAVRGVQKGFAK